MSAASSALSLLALASLALGVVGTVILAERRGLLVTFAPRSFRARALVDDPLLFGGLALTALLLTRAALVAASAIGNVSAGTWRSGWQCPHVTCLLTPDSPRYVYVTSELAFRFEWLHPFSSLDLAAQSVGARNGIAFCFVASLLARAGLSAPQALSVLAFVSGIALLFAMRAVLLRLEAPVVAILFAFSALPLVYAQLVMKETFDSTLLVALFAWLVRPRLRWLPAAAVVALALYYDREYYLYAAAGFVLLRIVLGRARPALKIAAIGAGVLLVTFVVVRRGIDVSYLRLYNNHATGKATLGSPSAWATGIFRSLFAPVSPRMGSPNYVNAFLDVPLFVVYTAYVCAATMLWRRLPLLRERLRYVANPWLLVFLAAVVVYGVVYTGFFRGRDAFSVLMFLALAHLLGVLRQAPERLPRRRLARA